MKFQCKREKFLINFLSYVHVTLRNILLLVGAITNLHHSVNFNLSSATYQSQFLIHVVHQPVLAIEYTYLILYLLVVVH